LAGIRRRDPDQARAETSDLLCAGWVLGKKYLCGSSAIRAGTSGKDIATYLTPAHVVGTGTRVIMVACMARQRGPGAVIGQPLTLRQNGQRPTLLGLGRCENRVIVL
jgi:hypothetical protein